jgi:lysozyme family protein
VNRFDYSLGFILQPHIEGGYSDGTGKNRNDRGGPTNYGVTQKTYDQFRRESGLSLRDVKLITMDEVKAVYRTMYWAVAKCGILPPPLDLYVFDGAVNMGPRRAAKILQSVLGVGADGIIGPVTIDALQEEVAAGRLDELCSNYLAARLDFYDELAEDDPTQRDFIAGWTNRIEHLRNA